MFLRTTSSQTPRWTGRRIHPHWSESYWNQGRPRHRIVCNLGRKDVLCSPAGPAPRGAPRGAARGSLGVARALWRELGLPGPHTGICRRPGPWWSRQPTSEASRLVRIGKADAGSPMYGWPAVGRGYGSKIASSSSNGIVRLIAAQARIEKDALALRPVPLEGSGLLRSDLELRRAWAPLAAHGYSREGASQPSGAGGAGDD